MVAELPKKNTVPHVLRRRRRHGGMVV